jgi:hypothetical protein
LMGDGQSTPVFNKVSLANEKDKNVTSKVHSQNHR